MKPASTKYKLWAIFSVFVWLHLTPAALSFPWMKTAEIRSDAETAVESEKYLSPDNTSTKTVEEWEQDLIFSHWGIWIESTALLILGLFFSWLLFCNSKHWPFLLGALAAITTYITLPPLIEMMASSEHTIGGYINMWADILSRQFREGAGFSYFFTIYAMFAWPVYSLALLFFSSTQVWSRIRGHTSAA